LKERERRIAACKRLTWEKVSARLVNLDDPLGAELDENEQRKPFSPSERVAISYAIEAREREKAKVRQKEHAKTAPGTPKNTSENFSEVLEEGGKAIDRTAEKLNWSGPTLIKAKAVVEAARQDPDLQDIVEEMDHTGNVSGAYNQLPPYARPAPAARGTRPGEDAVPVERDPRTQGAAVALCAKHNFQNAARRQGVPSATQATTVPLVGIFM